MRIIIKISHNIRELNANNSKNRGQEYKKQLKRIHFKDKIHKLII